MAVGFPQQGGLPGQFGGQQIPGQIPGQPGTPGQQGGGLVPFPQQNTQQLAQLTTIGGLGDLRLNTLKLEKDGFDKEQQMFDKFKQGGGGGQT